MVLYDRGLGYNEIVGGALKTYASHREPLGKDMFISSSTLVAKNDIQFFLQNKVVDGSNTSIMELVLDSQGEYEISEMLQDMCIKYEEENRNYLMQKKLKR